LKKLVVAVVVIWALAIVVGIGAAVAVVVKSSNDDDSAGSSTSSSSQTPDSPSTSSSDGSGGTDGDVPPGLEKFYDQQIDWTSCGDDDCGRLEVPVDYAHPDGETIELAVERHDATGDRIGSMIVNPGGPGAPGTDVPAQADFYFADPLLQAYDIVGFDPRGTGDSSPVDCLTDSQLDDYVAEDPGPDTPAEVKHYLGETRTFWKGCAARTGDILGHVSTIEAARDMDVLRAALGESKMTYFGFSYGTKLGATYADLFPDKVGKFVLDGAIDPNLDLYDSTISQAEGFEVALRSYVQNCIDQGDCFLGSTVDEGLQTISDLLDQIEADPLPTNQDRDLEIGNAVYGVITPLYNKDYWTYLDQALQQALDGDGSTLLALSDAYGSRTKNGTYSDNSLEAISVINCLDDPTTFTPKQVESHYGAFEKASPTFGHIFAWFLTACDGDTVKSSEPPIKIDAPGAAPIVVIGTTRDPATPYQEAVAMAKALDSGVLLTRDGDGHTGYNHGNSCIDDAVHAYLLHDKVPADGTKC
jgi:pimeloyl-ACP methyl ester carboxylesterase